MTIYSLATDEGDYSFSGIAYFTSRRALNRERHRRLSGRLEGGVPSADDAIKMLEARDAEIARLRSLIPVEQWVAP